MLDQLSGSSRSSPQSTQRSSGGADETRVERKAMLNRKCSMFNRKKNIYRPMTPRNEGHVKLDKNLTDSMTKFGKNRVKMKSAQH